METIQMLLARLDQISQKVDSMHANQSDWSSGSYGNQFEYESSECFQSWDEVNALPARPTGNIYSDPYTPAWPNDDFSYMNAPYQPHYMQNQHLSDFSHPTANQFYQDHLQIALPPPEKSRTEELLEQLILSQQKSDLEREQSDLEREQKFQQLFSGFDQLTAHSALLETHIAQLSAGPSQQHDMELPSQPEASPEEGVREFILRNGEQLESHEPEVQGRNEHFIETPAFNLSTYTDSCFIDIVYDRFMELEGSGTDEPVEDFKPAQESQIETPEPEMQKETKHQHETLTTEVNKVLNFFTNTNSCFMIDVDDRFMELEQEEGCKKDLLEQLMPDETIMQEDGGPWREEKQPMGYVVRPPLHDLKIMKWWDTG